MYKDDAIAFFGSKTKTALALGISPSSITQWGKFVPKSRAYEIECITNGALSADYYRDKLERETSQ
ncbi:TPA: Cro/CI family transcriptional regulator [Vibrio parahaemolyticus]|nr:Cro/Cl family transcriptional regulator [Vibrio parahaemolyticus]